MKIVISMKDPDAKYEQLTEQIIGEVKKLGLPKDEADAVIEKRYEKESAKLNHWMSYGEYLDVEFDTDAMTARVLEAKR